MALLEYSKTLVAGAPENVNDVQLLLNEARAAINAIDDEQINPNAGIGLSKLAIGTPGQIPVYNSLGRLARRTMVGDATINDLGELVLENGAASGQKYQLTRHSAVHEPEGGLQLIEGAWENLEDMEATIEGPSLLLAMVGFVPFSPANPVDSKIRFTIGGDPVGIERRVRAAALNSGPGAMPTAFNMWLTQQTGIVRVQAGSDATFNGTAGGLLIALRTN